MLATVIGSQLLLNSQSDAIMALSREPHITSDTSMDGSCSYQDIDGLSFLSSLLGSPLGPDLTSTLFPSCHLDKCPLLFWHLAVDDAWIMSPQLGDLKGWYNLLWPTTS